MVSEAERFVENRILPWIEGTNAWDDLYSPSYVTRSLAWRDPSGNLAQQLLDSYQYNDWQRVYGRLGGDRTMDVIKRISEGFGGAAEVLPETAAQYPMQVFSHPNTAHGMANPTMPVIGVNPIANMLEPVDRYGLEMLPMTHVGPTHELGHAYSYRALKHNPGEFLYQLEETFPHIQGPLTQAGRGTPYLDLFKILRDPKFVNRAAVTRSLNDYASTNVGEYFSEQLARDVVSGKGATPALDLIENFAKTTGMKGATRLPVVAGIAGAGLLADQLLNEGRIRKSVLPDWVPFGD